MMLALLKTSPEVLRLVATLVAQGRVDESTTGEWTISAVWVDLLTLLAKPGTLEELEVRLVESDSMECHSRERVYGALQAQKLAGRVTCEDNVWSLAVQPDWPSDRFREFVALMMVDGRRPNAMGAPGILKRVIKSGWSGDLDSLVTLLDTGVEEESMTRSDKTNKYKLVERPLLSRDGRDYERLAGTGRAWWGSENVYKAVALHGIRSIPRDFPNTEAWLAKLVEEGAIECVDGRYR